MEPPLPLCSAGEEVFDLLHDEVERALKQVRGYNPFSTPVPFWGHPRQIPSTLSPKRDYGPKSVNVGEHGAGRHMANYGLLAGLDKLWVENGVVNARAVIPIVNCKHRSCAAAVHENRLDGFEDPALPRNC